MDYSDYETWTITSSRGSLFTTHINTYITNVPASEVEPEHSGVEDVVVDRDAGDAESRELWGEWGCQN